MKRMTTLHQREPVSLPPRPIQPLPPGLPWNGLTLPEVPSADWPAMLAFEHAVDRLVREAQGTGRSIHEIVVGIQALAQSLSLSLTDAEIDQRVHAQLLANT